MNALLTVSTLELLQLWGELVEAYYGIHGFGGHTAELYAYRFMPYNPLYHTPIASSLAHDAQEVVEGCAASALRALCLEFLRHYPCTVSIDGHSIDIWYQHNRLFVHRAHVTVQPQEDEKTYRAEGRQESPTPPPSA